MTWPTEQAREAVQQVRELKFGLAFGLPGDVSPDVVHDGILDALAPHVAALVRAERAAALREAAEALPAYTEGEGREGIRTWKQPAQDAYSIAIEEAQSALRERADREAGR